MSRASSLDAALDSVASLIASVTANPKPTYTVGDKTVSWTEYLTALITQQEELEKARQRADGPFEVRSVGRS